MAKRYRSLRYGDDSFVTLEESLLNRPRKERKAVLRRLVNTGWVVEYPSWDKSHPHPLSQDINGKEGCQIGSKRALSPNLERGQEQTASKRPRLVNQPRVVGTKCRRDNCSLAAQPTVGPFSPECDLSELAFMLEEELTQIGAIERWQAQELFGEPLCSIGHAAELFEDCWPVPPLDRGLP